MSTRALRTTLIALVAVLALGTVPAAATPAGPKPKAIVLTATPTTAGFGQPVKLALSLTPKGGGQPDGGIITFRSGEQVLGTAEATKRITTITTDDLPVGKNVVIATFSGDAKVGAATSNSVMVTVDKARTTTSLTGAAGQLTVGTRAEIKASVRTPGAARPTGTVTFFSGDRIAKVPVNSSGVATWRPTFPVGTHEVVASYDGNETYATSDSNPFTVVVSEEAPTSTLDQGTWSWDAGTTENTTTAQTFTAGRTGSLDRVTLNLYAGGGDLTVEIRRIDNGLPTGELIGQGSATGVVLGPFELDLSSPAPVTAGTQYALVVLASRQTRFWRQSSGDPYAGGVYWARYSSFGWAETAGSDIAFQTFVLPA